MSKKLFRRIFNDENIPDDGLLHILFEPAVLRMDITVFGYHLFASYSKFFAAYSQAKLKRVFPKDLAAFIDSVLVDPHDFNIYTCNPFNTTNDRYYFNYEDDEDHVYIWLNVYLNFSRGDIFMDEKSNPLVESQSTADNGHSGAVQSTNNQGSSLDTVTDTSSFDYFKAQADQPVIDNSSGLPLWEKDLADDDDFYRYMQEDEKLKTYQMEISDTSTTSGVAVVTATIDETPIVSTDEDLSTRDLDSLTVEIHQYLNVARYSAIEVGKRLIQAKELVPHGEWANWLKDNFNLKQSSAKNFMAIARRFSNRQSIGDFDISTFKPTQLIALLALPKGKEKNFIETKAAEGTPVAEMSVKNLRSEIKKFSSDLVNNDSVSTQSSTSLVAVSDIEYALQETSTPISPTTSPQQADITYSSTLAHDVDKTLKHLFAVSSSLLNADNLQSVVSDAAHNDFQSFQLQLAQLAALLSQLQKYLADWQDDPINKRPIDRDAIINEIMQTMANDSSCQTSDYVLALISSWGYAKLHAIPDYLLPDLLKKVRNFKKE